MPKLVVILTVCALAFTGCEEARGFRVESFSHENLVDVALNAALVFRFSEELNPHSINSDTIQIFTKRGGERVDAAGTFEVKGRQVTWFPRPTNQPYPVDRYPDHRTESSSHPEWMLATDAGLNTSRGGVDYDVVIQSLPHPNTVRNQAGRPLRVAYRSSFRTAPIGRRLFTRDAPYFRNSLRVADVLAYDGGATFSGPGRALGFKDWVLNPKLTAGENPLFLSPAHALQACLSWRGRDNTGEWIDQVFGVQLTPRMSDAEMQQNTFPAGLALRDERLISNLRGAQRGRGEPVSGVELYFTQPLPPQTFIDSRAIVVERLADVADGHGTPLSFAHRFDNNAELLVGHLAITFDEPVEDGWIRITIASSAIRAMTGDTLEANAGDRFVYLWPVRINALGEAPPRR